MSENPRRCYLLFDCDGVLADSAVSVLRQTNRQFAHDGHRCRLKISDLTSWGTITRAAQNLGGPDYASRINQAWFNASLLLTSPPYPEVIAAKAQLARLPFVRTLVVTTRLPSLKGSTVAWLNEWDPSSHHGADLRIRRDTLQTGDEFKLSVARMLNAQLFFEDSPDTARILTNGQIKVALLPQPWNRECSEFDDFRITHRAGSVLKAGLQAYKQWLGLNYS